jgi:hypothetical protein
MRPSEHTRRKSSGVLATQRAFHEHFIGWAARSGYLMLHTDVPADVMRGQQQPFPGRPRRTCGNPLHRDHTIYGVEHVAHRPRHKHRKPRRIGGRLDPRAKTSGLANSQTMNRCRRIPDITGYNGPLVPDCHWIPCLSYHRYTYYRCLHSSDRCHQLALYCSIVIACIGVPPFFYFTKWRHPIACYRTLPFCI